MDTEFEKKAVAPLMHIYIRNRKYFQRNAAIAMGNSGDAEMVSYLADAMRDPEELVRAHSAWALGESGWLQSKGHTGILFKI